MTRGDVPGGAREYEGHASEDCENASWGVFHSPYQFVSRAPTQNTQLNSDSEAK